MNLRSKSLPLFSHEGYAQSLTARAFHHFKSGDYNAALNSLTEARKNCVSAMFHYMCEPFDAAVDVDRMAFCAFYLYHVAKSEDQKVFGAPFIRGSAPGLRKTAMEIVDTPLSEKYYPLAEALLLRAAQMDFSDPEADLDLSIFYEKTGNRHAAIDHAGQACMKAYELGKEEVVARADERWKAINQPKTAVATMALIPLPSEPLLAATASLTF